MLRTYIPTDSVENSSHNWKSSSPLDMLSWKPIKLLSNVRLSSTQDLGWSRDRAVCVCELGNSSKVRRTYLHETVAFIIIYRCLFWFDYLTVGSTCIHLLIVLFHGFDHFNGGWMRVIARNIMWDFKSLFETSKV